MSDVTKTGLEGVRPGRDATVGVVAGRRDGRRGRRRGGEQPMVPDAEFDSYYGLPVLNAPVWHGREIAGYLFLGGLAGASSVLAAGAQVAGSRELATRAKVVATGAAALGGVALVKDLGRPARFANMLRVFKPTSPMSVGSWLLAGYVPGQQPRTDAHRRGRLEDPQHVGEAGRAPEVLDERDPTERGRARRHHLGPGGELATAGDLRAGGQHRGCTGEATQEEVARDLAAVPHRRVEHR